MERRREQFGDVALHWLEAGTGPGLLLLHGFPESAWSWKHQIEALAGAGFRVAALDLRGYGESQARGPYDLATLSADIVEFTRSVFSGPVGLVGHDWGGGIAWHAAAHHPELFARLCILNAPHPAPYQRAVRSRPRQLRASWYMYFFALPVLPEVVLRGANGRWLRRFVRHHCLDTRPFDDETLDRHLRPLLDGPGLSAALAYYRSAVRRGLLNPREFQHLPTVQMPTRLLWGRHDPSMVFDLLVPPTLALVPEIELEVFEAGHYLHQEQPERVTERMLEFFEPLLGLEQEVSP